MNGKKLIVMLSVLFALFTAVPSFSAHNESEVRVVNLDVVGSERLNDHILVALATMKTAGNSNLFPEISMFKVSKDLCLIDSEDEAYSTTDEHSISIDGKIHLRNRFSFASFNHPSNPETRVTVAIVKSDGTVINLSDEAVSIDGTKKNLNGELCLVMEPHDVVLVFVDPVAAGIFSSDSFERTSRTSSSVNVSVTAENSSFDDFTSNDPSSNNPANGPKGPEDNDKISKDNKGHGNNEDGIDGDNPGKGSGGPNADKAGNSGDDESNGGGSSVGNNSQSENENDNNNESKDNKGHGNNEDGIDGDNPGNGSGGPNADKDGNSGNDESNGGGSSVGNNKSESGSSTGNGSGGNNGNGGNDGNKGS